MIFHSWSLASLILWVYWTFVGFLEQTFRIKIDDDELTPDNFANIRRLVAFVESKNGWAGVSTTK